MSELVAYFGFGSLVNKHTLRTSYVDIIPARLDGWRRHWQAHVPSTEKSMALLSIHEDRDTSIDGMLVLDKIENLPLVDEREVGYERISLKPSAIEIHSDSKLPDDLYVYIAHGPETKGEGGPLLQSYVDAVMQGFKNEFGNSGLRKFMDTTSHFDRLIIKDRDEPLYPRSVTLTSEEASLFDQLLDEAGVQSL